MLTTSRLIENFSGAGGDLVSYMGQGLLQAKTGTTFYLLSVHLKTNAEDDSTGMIGDPQAEMSRFTKLAAYMQQEVNDDDFDSGSLTQSLSIKMREGMAVVNPPYK